MIIPAFRTPETVMFSMEDILRVFLSHKKIKRGMFNLH